MAKRTELIAELASNHGGDWSLAVDLVQAAAEHGADWVKVQLYDAADLRTDDPQRAWLTEAQVTSQGLAVIAEAAAHYQLGLMASVFSSTKIPLAREAGLAAIKIGSGESHRRGLVEACRAQFTTIWLSVGLAMPEPTLAADPSVVLFHGVSQYPTPTLRGRARLLQVPRNHRWGWSDHGSTLEVAKEAILLGATYLERHLGFPGRSRFQAWDSPPADFQHLRDYAEACAWEQTPSWHAAVAAYRGRWQDKEAEGGEDG